MPRYFSITWLLCIVLGMSLAHREYGMGALPFLFPIIVAGFFLSLLAVLIVDLAARFIGSKHDPFASRFDWRDD
jgi:hypothetical protein